LLMFISVCICLYMCMYMYQLYICCALLCWRK